MGVPAGWDTLLMNFGLLAHVITYLEAASLVKLFQVNQQSCKRIRKLFRALQETRTRLALASLCYSHLRIEFQALYQELDTQNIPRANDRRVPPHVVSSWIERGQVTDELVTINPVQVPDAHANGITVHFVADTNGTGKRPMLMDVVQTNYRIYTMVTVKLLRSELEREVVLRSYSYLKEFKEWKTPTLSNKRMLAAASIGSHLGRFDLNSQDGSMVLELDVPVDMEAQMDCYLVNQATVSIHLQELLQLHFHSLRPIQSLPEPMDRDLCILLITFRSIAGIIISSCRVPGSCIIERRENEAVRAGNSAELGHERYRTGVETFDIVTIKGICSSNPNIKVQIPDEPGYAWVEVRQRSGLALSRPSRLYFYFVALHYGARQVLDDKSSRELQIQWLPGLLESYPSPGCQRRRCLKGKFRLVTSSLGSTLKELQLLAQRLPAVRLDRYAARVESHTRHETIGLDEIR